MSDNSNKKNEFFNLLENLDSKGLENFLRSNPDFDVKINYEQDGVDFQVPNSALIEGGLITGNAESAIKVLEIPHKHDPKYLSIQDNFESNTLSRLFYAEKGEDIVIGFLKNNDIDAKLLSEKNIDGESLGDLIKNNKNLIRKITNPDLILKLVNTKVIDKDFVFENGETLLHMPCIINNTKAFEVLLDLGFPLLPSNLKESPFDIATKQQNTEILKLMEDSVRKKLVPRGYNIEINKLNVSEFKIAMKILGEEIAMRLLHSYLGLESPIFWAKKFQTIEFAEFLLDYYIAHPRMQRSDRDLMLCQAAAIGSIKFVNLLIEKGFDVNSMHDGTALHYAAREGHTEVVKLLIEKGANLNLQTTIGIYSTGFTPVHEAVINGHTEVVKLLIQNGADLNLKNCFGQGPLHTAAKKGNIEMANLLIENGADVNQKHKRLVQTPLHRAAGRGNIKMVELLIKKGADVNQKDRSGHTPIFFAVDRDNAQIVELLLNNGADINKRSFFSNHTITIPRERGHKDIVKLLEPTSNDITSKLKRCFAAIKKFFCSNKLAKETSVAPVALEKDHASEVSINPDILKTKHVDALKQSDANASKGVSR